MEPQPSTTERMSHETASCAVGAAKEAAAVGVEHLVDLVEEVVADHA